MGNRGVVGRSVESFPHRSESECLDVNDTNGYILSNVTLNDDVLTEILSLIPPEDLVKMRMVCKSWCNLIDSSVWNYLLTSHPYSSKVVIRSLPWYLKYWILHKDILHRNLIRNGCGNDRFDYWEIHANGGNHMIVDASNVGTEDEPPFPTCFVTSYGDGMKSQKINFLELGIAPAIIDIVQPDITISEWYAGRFDCRAVYKLDVNLMDSENEIIDGFSFTDNCGGDDDNKWKQVTHVFRNYGQGVCYIEFVHGGRDRQFWAGHYGSRMTGASVVLSV